MRSGIADCCSLFGVVLALSVSACGSSSDEPGGAIPDGGLPMDAATLAFEWNLPPGFPSPEVPEDNPMTWPKVELGRALFYDTRLSGNGTFACASCHDQAKAFTDGLAQPSGSTGEMHRRSSMGLANVAYASTLTWANDVIGSLEEQALIPMFGETPVELGLVGMEAELLGRLRGEEFYRDAFREAFPEADDPIQLASITRAIASFQRSLISGDSPYDRYASGDDPDAISASAKRGLDLFFSERTECFHCHGGFNFSDSTNHAGTVFRERNFHNNALYNVDGQGGYPATDQGLVEVSLDPIDMGRFKAPSLRNIAVTAPYMHDGSLATLDEVIDHYAAGGRKIESGPNTGNGAASPLKSEFVTGFLITEQEREDLKAFLESLTDERFLTNPAHANPWTEEP